MRIAYRDWSLDPAAWADELGVSKEAVDLYLDSEVIDLHIDSFIWTRIFGYDLFRRHGKGLFGRHFYSQVDFPRVLEAQMTGAIWVITTNPFVPARLRQRAFWKNLERIKSLLAEAKGYVRHVRNVAEYRAARAEGLHGAFLGIQGGNAIDRDLEDIGRIPEGDILRVTLVHLTNATLGATSAPVSKIRRDQGLTDRGREYVERLNAAKIFVDLAHISREGFFDAVEVHDKSQPLMVTHTGVCGVHDHWRNLTDAQVRAVADTGGCVGVMFQESFLGKTGNVSAVTVAEHLEHIRDVGGEDLPCIGTDYDGAISPPPDMPTVLEMPVLVQVMLERGWTEKQIRKVLGDNFLRTVEALRG